jgi:hypothetical protein
MRSHVSPDFLSPKLLNKFLLKLVFNETEEDEMGGACGAHGGGEGCDKHFGWEA